MIQQRINTTFQVSGEKKFADAAFKQPATAARQLLMEIGKLQKQTAFEKLKSESKAYQQALEELRRAQGKVNEESNNSGKSSKVSVAGMVSMANHATDLAGKAIQAARSLGEMAIEGEKLKSLEAGFKQLGGSSAELDKLREATKGLVPDASLMKIYNMSEAMGVGSENIAQFARIAQGASNLLGTSVEKNLDDLMTGLSRGSKLIIDNLGIVMRDAATYEAEYARSHGISVGKLTDAQKKLAFQYEVVRGSSKQLAAADNVTMNGVQKLEASMKNLYNDGISLVAEGINTWLDSWHQLGKQIDKVSGAISTLTHAVGINTKGNLDNIHTVNIQIKTIKKLKKEFYEEQDAERKARKERHDSYDEFYAQMAAGEQLIYKSGAAKLYDTAALWATRAALDEVEVTEEKKSETTRRHTKAVKEQTFALVEMQNALGTVARNIAGFGEGFGAQQGIASFLMNSEEAELAVFAGDLIVGQLTRISEANTGLFAGTQSLFAQWAQDFEASGILEKTEQWISSTYALAEAKKAEQMANRATAAGLVGVVQRNLDLFGLSESKKAWIGHFIEVARSIADFAAGNIVGGAGHALAAASYLVAARKAGKGGGGASSRASGPGGGGMRRSTRPVAAARPAGRGRGSTNNITQIYQFGTGRAGQAIAGALNEEVNRRSGVGLDPRLSKAPGRAGL